MPINNGKYVSPTWANNASPAIDDTELQAITDTVEKSQDGVRLVTKEQNLKYSSTNQCKMVYGNGVYLSQFSTQDIPIQYSFDSYEWYETELPPMKYWSGLCYTGDKFVAVGDNRASGESGSIFYSTDGIHWSQGTTSAELPLTTWGFAVGNGKIIGVGSGNPSTIIISTDGITWNVISNLSSLQYMSKIVYGNGVFLMSGNSGFTVSEDGENWTQPQKPFSGLYALTYGKGLFVASFKGFIAYSTDGLQWSTSSPPSSLSDPYALAYGNGTFVCANYNELLYSRDGIVWEKGDSDDAFTWQGCWYVKDRFIAFYPTGGGGLAYSSDGIHWAFNKTTQFEDVNGNDATMSAVEALADKGIIEREAIQFPKIQVRAMAYGGGAILASAYSASEGTYNNAFSKDGRIWQTAPTTGNRIGWAAYGKGIWVGVGSLFYYTRDLSKGWSEASFTPTQAAAVVAYGEGKFVALSSLYQYSSDDGISWTQKDGPLNVDAWRNIAYGNGRFIAISYTKGIYSDDGVNWTEITLPQGANWNGIAYGNGKWVLTSGGSGNNNLAAYSTDGINWTTTTLPVATIWRYVAYGNERFVLVGNNGNCAYSDDGITWVGSKLPTTDHYWAIVYGDGKFYTTFQAVRNGKSCYYSTDGVHWDNSYYPPKWKVGDIQETMRTDLGDDWLLCNGSTVDPYEYPDLVPLLKSEDVSPISSFRTGSQNSSVSASQAVMASNGAKALLAYLGTTQSGTSNPPIYIAEFGSTTSTKLELGNYIVNNNWPRMKMHYLNNYWCITANQSPSNNPIPTLLSSSDGKGWLKHEFTDYAGYAIGDVGFKDNQYIVVLQKTSSPYTIVILTALSTTSPAWIAQPQAPTYTTIGNLMQLVCLSNEYGLFINYGEWGATTALDQAWHTVTLPSYDVGLDTPIILPTYPNGGNISVLEQNGWLTMACQGKRSTSDSTAYYTLLLEGSSLEDLSLQAYGSNYDSNGQAYLVGKTNSMNYAFWYTSNGSNAYCIQVPLAEQSPQSLTPFIYDKSDTISYNHSLVQTLFYNGQLYFLKIYNDYATIYQMNPPMRGKILPLTEWPHGSSSNQTIYTAYKYIKGK